MFALENAQSLFGILVVLGICWGLSEKRSAFPWKLAIGVVLLQVVLVLVLFGLAPARAVLAGAGHAVEGLASATQTGVAFVFGFLAGGPGQPYSLTNPSSLFVFAFRVLPVILVVCALAALLWHWKILKWLTQGFGFIFSRTMGLRGPPALATAATIFMGQVEGPIFIRSYLPMLSRSELFMLIAVGMSCVSGSTLVAYATILHDVLPNAASHVLIASIISAPAGILLARILVPSDIVEDEKTADHDPASDKRLRKFGRRPDQGDRPTAFQHRAQRRRHPDRVRGAWWPWSTSILGALGDDRRRSRSAVERVLGIAVCPAGLGHGHPVGATPPAAGSLLGVKLVLTEFTAFIRMGADPHRR